jgi:hypothetical protein
VVGRLTAQLIKPPAPRGVSDLKSVKESVRLLRATPAQARVMPMKSTPLVSGGNSFRLEANYGCKPYR